MDNPDLWRRQFIWTSALTGLAQTVTPFMSLNAATSGPLAPVDPTIPLDGSVSVTKFMSPEQVIRSRAGDLSDCTSAFAQAQSTAGVVLVPPGRYGLSNLRLRDGTSLLGISENAVRIDQLSPDYPAINCLSDETSGQLSDIAVKGMTIYGHSHARVAVLMVVANKQFAVWRSRFEYMARNTFRALEVQGADAANVFHCQFDITSEGTQDTAVLVTGGTYNIIRLFLTKCHSWSVDDSSSSTELRVISENCMMFRGQNNRIWATLEEIPFQPASAVGIEDRGYGNTFETPTIIMSSDDKLLYAFKPFSNSIFVNPQIIGRQDAIIHPFSVGIGEPFTVIGGRSQARNPVETIYDGASDHTKSNLVTFVGGSTGLRL